jgi:hypothetical protein
MKDELVDVGGDGKSPGFSTLFSTPSSRFKVIKADG